MRPDENQNGRTERFIDLLNSHQRKIYAFIICLVGNYNDADDIMQETARVMWQKFSEFEEGTDFLAWSRTIAYYRILDFRHRHKRDSRIFRPDVFEILCRQAQSGLQDSDNYRELLRQCLEKLKRDDLHMIQLKYSVGLSVKEISGRYGRSTQAVYRSIGRIHNLLRQCIKLHLRREGMA